MYKTIIIIFIISIIIIKIIFSKKNRLVLSNGVFYDKIFVIGFNKTGTTAIHKLFRINNLNSLHRIKWDVENYMCFSDGPDRYNFKKYYKQYPNSLFILNTRNLKDWVISRFKHAYAYTRLFSDPKFRNNWGYPATLEKAINFIQDRRSHYIDVLEFFKDKNSKLIILNIDKPNWINFISDILEFKNRDVGLINTRETVDIIDKIEEVTKKAFSKLNYNRRQQNTVLLDYNKNYLKLYRNNLI